MGDELSHQCHELIEKKDTIFESKEGEVYRIPSLFYNRDKKVLMAFAENRETENDNSSQALVMKTGTVNKDETTKKVTVEWSELKPVEEARLEGHRTMNPCPVYEKTSKTLFLFFICVEGTVSESWQIRTGCNKARLCYVTTTDEGQNWSSVTDLMDALVKKQCWATFAVGPGHGLQTEAGRLIVPLYAYASSSCSSCCCCCIGWCISCCIKHYGSSSHALSLHSDNKGETWRFGKMLKKGSNECEMAEFFDEEEKNSFIYCNARTTEGHRVEAVSRSNGCNKYFSELSPEKLPETGNGCQGSVVSFPAQGANTEGDPSQSKNKWLLFSHPSSKSERVDLGVYLNKSPDKPEKWSKPCIINKGPSGYSDLAYMDDGWFACLMECGKKSEIEQIAFKVFSYNAIEQGTGE